MQAFSRVGVEIVLLMVLVAMAIAVEYLTPVPFEVTAVALITVILATYLAFDVFQEAR